MRRHAVRFLLAILVAVSGLELRPAAQAPAPGITVAAASDLQAVMPQIAAQFERSSGQPVRVTLGSSGNFFAQIQNGAPFDVYLSADIDYPRQLERAGLAEPGSLYQYAIGELVLMALKGRADLSSGLRALANPAIRRVAVANPEHAPYGRAAVAALKNAGIYDQVQGKLVLGENISQAAQFVQSGNADAGIVALSISLAPGLRDLITAVPLPAGSYPPIEQAAIVVRASRNKQVAIRFLDFLKSPAATALLQQFGFKTPAAAR